VAGLSSVEAAQTALADLPKEKAMLGRLLPTNEHPVERVLRVVIGLALIAIVFTGPKTPWGWIGVVPLLTGLIGSCPLYTLFGWRTCPLKAR
jgi:hypothetical protein